MKMLVVSAFQQKKYLKNVYMILLIMFNEQNVVWGYTGSDIRAENDQRPSTLVPYTMAMISYKQMLFGSTIQGCVPFLVLDAIMPNTRSKSSKYIM